MNKQVFKDLFIWGFVLWFIGYVLGIVFFMFVPKSFIGWFILPIGIAISLWILIKKVRGDSLTYFLKIACIWTFIAIVFDYIFIIKLFKSGIGYYKLDVYLYYLITFLLPILVGWRKQMKEKGEKI
ncbi:MAG: hypothetical protein ACREGI_05750 [Candidatus Levyibacteriota bacterium]